MIGKVENRWVTADQGSMLMVEVIAYSMVTVLALVTGGFLSHLVFQSLVAASLARTARAEASNLDAELRNLQDRRNDF